MGCFQFFPVTTIHLLGRSNTLLDLLLQDGRFSRSVEKRDLMPLDIMEQLSNRLDVFNTTPFFFVVSTLVMSPTACQAPKTCEQNNSTDNRLPQHIVIDRNSLASLMIMQFVWF